MKMRRRGTRSGSQGQILILFALTGTLIILGLGLVVDGGYALAQRRASQNASDFAALAGARVIAEWIGGDTANGTDANVRMAITNTLNINGAIPATFGESGGPVYVNKNGAIVPSPGAAASYVGNGAIPTGAVGVKVVSSRTWTPFFLGIAGIRSWSAAADATARGGWSTAPPSGIIFPVGIASSFFSTHTSCAGDINTTTPSDPCYAQHLTPGNLNVPGGFGWLKFGATGKCTGYGLGMDPNAGCAESAVFLDSEIGPPPNSYGCCTAAGKPGSADKIGSLPGNKASADCTYYVDNDVIVTVPVWDTAGGVGANAWYHIIGFAGFQLTGCPGGKEITGVWRRLMTPGPVTDTPGPGSFSLGVQLIH
jgi:Flp pilus assembly protein TadG